MTLINPRTPILLIHAKDPQKRIFSMALAVTLNLPELGYCSQFNGISISGTPNLYCETNVNLTLRANGSVRVRLVPFVHSQLQTHKGPFSSKLSFSWNSSSTPGGPQTPLGATVLAVNHKISVI